MRPEQKDHFEIEDCLKDVSGYREFVRSALLGRETLLDLGTGAGYGVLAVAGYVGKVIATDLEADMIDAARKTCEIAKILNVEFSQMAAEHIDWPDGSIDAVQIRFSLHHFGNAQKVLSEVRRVLKPDGVLLLADAFFSQSVVQVWTITSLLRHGKWTPYFTYRQHMDMLAEASLCIEKMRPILIEQSFDDFYNSAPEAQREPLQAIVEHLTEDQRKLMHFREVNGQSKYAYDGFELIARKISQSQ